MSPISRNYESPNGESRFDVFVFKDFILIQSNANHPIGQSFSSFEKFVQELKLMGKRRQNVAGGHQGSKGTDGYRTPQLDKANAMRQTVGVRTSDGTNPMTH